MKPPMVPASAATKRRARWYALVTFLTTCFGIALLAKATSSGWIFLGGPIADQGVGTPPGGEVDITIGNADYTASSADFYGASVQVKSSGSLTADRKVTVPRESGAWKVVTNNTTGGFNIIWGGSAGTTVTIANGQTVNVNCPDGINWVSAGGGSGGTGGGFDAGSFDGAPGYFYWDGSAAQPPVWKSLASGELPTVTLSGDTTGSGSAGAITTTTGKVNGTTYPAGGSLTTGNYPRVTGASAVTYSAIQSGDLTSALASPPAIGGTTPAAGTFATLTGRSGDRYADAGGSTVEMPSPCGALGTSTNGPVDSCTFSATFTDATTWVNLFPTGFLISSRTSATIDIEYSITDQTDAADAGPVDLQVGQFRFTATASNGGTVTVFDEIGGSASTSALTIAAAPTSKSYISGVSGSVVPTCQVNITGSYVQPQCKGRASKTDVGQFTMQNARGLQ
jgi:hypothetical protein